MLLTGGPCPRLEEEPFERLRVAGTDASPLDRAILVRHCLRRRASQLGPGGLATIDLPADPSWPDDEVCREAGMVVEHRQSAVRTVRAMPWRPSWLEGAETYPPDAAACSGERRRTSGNVPGDPFLRAIGRECYRSLGQRAAARAALSARPGSTLLVNLPTGDGKSLIFHLVHGIGYADSDPRGVTVVVAPTVPLIFDHERSMRERGLVQHEVAYVGGRDETNRAIAERIREGAQGIVFAAPEAVVAGRLGGAVASAARQGRLRALIVDEAHLVDGWGADFRPGFQTLSGYRRMLIREAAPGTEPRTLLLTATLTRRSAATLETLFGAPGPFGVVSASQMRAEIDYWVGAVTDQAERDARVAEALLHLPRPAILYVTAVEAARRWHGLLTEAGYRRMRCVHGHTPPDEREETVASWAAGRVDVVVATSAFGLGIDNAHVRAVVHACIPETLDRFYQEVGRGGRDGAASVSLLLPADGDAALARAINRRRLITVGKGLRRWRAMFHDRDRVQHTADEFSVRLDVAPGNDERHIDMVNERSIEWSAKTLTLMAGAGLVELTSAPATADDGGASGAPGIFQRLRTLAAGHLDHEVWASRIQAFRLAGHAADRESLAAMLRFMAGRTCPCEVIAPLYEIPEGEPCGPVGVARRCGGCTLCRTGGVRLFSALAGEPPQPWSPAALRGPALDLLGGGDRLAVFYPAQATRGFSRRLHEVVGRLAALGFRNVVASPAVALDWDRILRPPHRGPVFVSDRLVPNRLPRGPTLVVAAPGDRIEPVNLRAAATPDQATARIVMMPDDLEHPQAAGLPWSALHGGAREDFDTFWARLRT